MERRVFLKVVAGGAAAFQLLGCSGDDDDDDGADAPTGGGSDAPAGGADSGGGGADAGGNTPDAQSNCVPETVIMYDTYAVALYFDGEIGPTTGIIEVEYVLAGEAVPMDFWHGHGGILHAFVVLPEHLEALKRGEKVMIETTEVEGHSHYLFIDPTDPQWRVEGAEGIPVPFGCD